MPRKNMEIYLKSLYVRNNGVLEKDKAGDNTLMVELIHPTTGRGTILFQNRDLKLKDGETIDFESVREKDADQLKYDEFDRLMFKEEVLNRAKLEILLIHTEDVKDFDIFLAKIFSSIINLGSVLLPGIVTAISGAVKETAQKISEKKKEKDEKIYIIGKASRILSLDDKELKDLELGKSKDISIKLAVPRTITKETSKFFPPNKKQKPERVEVEVLKESKANDFNAILTISIKFVE